MPSELWVETDCQLVERGTKGEGELTAENPEEQQHTEHQSSPSPRQRQVDPNFCECGADSFSSPATHAAPVMATMMHKTV